MPTPFIEHLVPDGLESLVVEPGPAAVLGLRRDPSEPRPALSPLWLVGEVDLVTAPWLAERLRTASSPAAAGLVVLDVSRVTFMDLDGLRMLLRLQTDLSGDGTALVLRAPSLPVRLLLAAARPWATLSVLTAPAAQGVRTARATRSSRRVEG